MQVNQNNNTSFGFNAVKFVDNNAEQVFNNKNKGIKNEVLTKLLEEVKNIKPQTGPDVDVYISQLGKDTPYATSYLTYHEKGSRIRKGCIHIDGKTHKPNAILEAFKKLANQVDEIRGMEKEYQAEKAANPKMFTKRIFY